MQFERVGSNLPITVDVRILAATNRDLKTAVAAGAFRQDLFYRLNVFPIHVPSLRERPDDIPLLVEYLIEHYAKKTGKKIRTIKKGTLELFAVYDWPGNVRELQNVIERAVILSEGDTFSVDEAWLVPEGRSAAGPAAAFAGTLARRERELERHEREAIEAALAASGGRIAGPSGAAAKLGIPRQTLDSKIRALRINKHRFKTI
jgi:formate hydrogenlyase transcriptional activator